MRIGADAPVDRRQAWQRNPSAGVYPQIELVVRLHDPIGDIRQFQHTAGIVRRQRQTAIVRHRQLGHASQIEPGAIFQGDVVAVNIGKLGERRRHAIQSQVGARDRHELFGGQLSVAQSQIDAIQRSDARDKNCSGVTDLKATRARAGIRKSPPQSGQVNNAVGATRAGIDRPRQLAQLGQVNAAAIVGVERKLVIVLNRAVSNRRQIHQTPRATGADVDIAIGGLNQMRQGWQTQLRPVAGVQAGAGVFHRATGGKCGASATHTQRTTEQAQRAVNKRRSGL